MYSLSVREGVGGDARAEVLDGVEGGHAPRTDVSTGLTGVLGLRQRQRSSQRLSPGRQLTWWGEIEVRSNEGNVNR